MKKNLYLFIITLLSVGCAEKISTTQSSGDNFKEEDYVTSSMDGMMVLGEKLNNPYSLANMQAAYNELCKTKSVASSNLEATDLYVRFLPKDSTDFAVLSSLDLELFDYPLDYEIITGGDYYHDPTIPETEITWQYTKVKPDFEFPDMQYEILDECYIPEEEEELTKSSSVSLFGEELEIMAIKMADLPEEYSISEDYIGTKAKAKKSPCGYVRIYKDNENYVPAKGVKIRCHYFLKWDSDFTDDNGNYNISKRFSCNPTYALILDNVQGFKVWGNYGFLGAANHNVKNQSKSGYNFEIYRNSQAWKWLIINNAAYDYYNDCKLEGVSLPHKEIRIWSIKSDKDSWGAAPMFRRIGGVGLDVNSVAANVLSNLIIIPATTILMTVFKSALPDIIIVSQEGYSGFESIYSTTYHELCHASHCKKVGATYWSRYASYIMSHGFDYGDYGGDKDSGVCEVGEAWAYAVERIKYKQQFGYSDDSGSDLWFNGSIDAVHCLLDNKFITKSQLFGCLTKEIKTTDALCEKIASLVDTTGRKSVDYIFAINGALSNQTQWKILNSTNHYVYVESTNKGIESRDFLYNGDKMLVSACKGDLSDSLLVDNLKIYYNGVLCYFQEEGKVKVSRNFNFHDKNKWTKKLFSKNGKKYTEWIYEFKENKDEN